MQILREPSRETSIGACTSGDIFKLRLPFRRGNSSFESRYGAIYSQDSRGVVCLDLKHAATGRAKFLHSVSALEECCDPVVAVSQSAVAVAGQSSAKIFDFSNNQISDLKLPVSNHRSKSASSAHWSHQSPFLLGVGTRAGAILLWDLRTNNENPASFLPPLVMLDTSIVKFGLDNNALASVHGDAAIVWDIRQLKIPLRQFAPREWSSRISSIDWLSGAGDLIVSAADCVYRINCTDNTVEFVSACAYASFVCALPSATGNPLIAFEQKPCSISVMDPFSLEVIDSEWETPESGEIHFMQDSRSLLVMGEENMYFRSILNFSGFWSNNVLPSAESSPRMDQICQASVLHLRLLDLANRIKRLYMEAEVESVDNSSWLEISVPVSEFVQLKLRLALSDELVNQEVWWALAEGAEPPLVSIEEIREQFTSKIFSLTDVIAVLSDLKKFLYLDGEQDEERGIPFPPTCGVCWSPRGDLFRFHSLKGLAPWPKHRERLTMANFSNLKREIDLITDSSSSDAALSNGESGALSIPLNAVSLFIEPDTSDPDEEEELDAEFNRRLTPDQCVQFLPAAVFEVTVEDHWFAAVAPAIKFSDDRMTAINSLINCCRSSAAKSKIVRETFELIAQMVPSLSFSPTYLMASAILEERMQFLYKMEETQAVAVLAVIFNDLMTAAFSNLQFVQSVNLLVHDHAVLFQRLGCFASSRFLEKFKSQSLPLLLQPEAMIFETAKSQKILTCSVCQVPVRGMGLHCPACGHGGHWRHVAALKVCAERSCGCACKLHSRPRL